MSIKKQGTPEKIRVVKDGYKEMKQAVEETIHPELAEIRLKKEAKKNSKKDK